MTETSSHGQKVFLRGRGGSDAAHQADATLYHTLLQRHTELERTSQKTERGVDTLTRVTSGDPALVKILHDHVTGMKKRYDAGRAVRSWDPLFVAFFDHRDAIELSWELLEDGISVSLASDDAEVRKLIHLHDETLHTFVRSGFNASRHESPHRPDAEGLE